MRKLIYITICIAFLICLSGAQRRYDHQFEDRKRRSSELSVQRRKHSHQRNTQKLQNRTQLHQKQSIMENRPAQEHKQTSLSQANDQTSQSNPRKYFHRSGMNRREKPLIKLIFVMLGALLIITFILLLNFIAKRQRQQQHIPHHDIARHAEDRGQIIGGPHIATNLEQEITMQKQRLRHLEKLKQIRGKFLISVKSSNNQFITFSNECHIQDIEPTTPVFGTSINSQTNLQK